MEGENREPDDFERYKRLIFDPRTAHGMIPFALRAFPERAPELRDIALARVAQLDPRSDENFSYDMVLADFPPGSFSEPLPLLAELLRDPERRRRLDRLAARFGEAEDVAPR